MMKYRDREFTRCILPLGVLGVLLLMTPYKIQGQGEVNPTSAPAPFMKSLEQIYQQGESNSIRIDIIGDDIEMIDYKLDVIDAKIELLAYQEDILSNMLVHITILVESNSAMLSQMNP